MSIEQPEIIDIVSREGDGTISLIVSDHLGWQDLDEHVTALNHKLKTYFEFIRTGDLVTQFPDTIGKPVQVLVKFHYRPHPKAHDFFSKIEKKFEDIGVVIKFEIFAETPYKN
jgi:hypothetical protein